MTGSEELGLVVALKQSLEDEGPPKYATEGPVAALWHVGKGNYDRAKKLLEPDFSKEAAWVRAHLHRRQGDDAAAAQYYKEAGKDPSIEPVDKEWTQVAAGLLLNVQ